MARHIFIHFHDAGTAHDPSNGQFTSGPGGGNSAHHKAAAEGHRQQMIAKTSKHPDFYLHNMAYEGHRKVAHRLEQAAGFHKAGDPELSERALNLAKKHLSKFSKFEARIGK